MSVILDLETKSWLRALVSVITVACSLARVYVEAEEQALSQQLDTMMREESWAPMEDAQQTRVLHSASNLFAVIKRSSQRCSKHVSHGEALLQLLGAFQVARQEFPHLPPKGLRLDLSFKHALNPSVHGH